MNANAISVIEIVEMIHDGATMLYERDPQHELLRYITAEQTDENWTIFIDRFGEKNTENKWENYLIAYRNYHQAILDAVAEINAKWRSIRVCTDTNSY